MQDLKLMYEQTYTKAELEAEKKLDSFEDQEFIEDNLGKKGYLD